MENNNTEDRSKYAWGTDQELQKKVNNTYNKPQIDSTIKNNSSFSESNNNKNYEWETEDHLRNDYYDKMIKKEQEHNRMLAEEERRKTQSIDNTSDKIAHKMEEIRIKNERRKAEEKARMQKIEKEKQATKKEIKEREKQATRNDIKEIEGRIKDLDNDTSYKKDKIDNLKTDIKNLESDIANKRIIAEDLRKKAEDERRMAEEMYDAYDNSKRNIGQTKKEIYNTYHDIAKIARETAMNTAVNISSGMIPDSDILLSENNGVYNRVATTGTNNYGNNGVLQKGVINGNNTEELNQMVNLQRKRVFEDVEYEKFLETTGRVINPIIKEVENNDIVDTFHKGKRQINTITSTIAYLSANSAARSALNEFNRIGGEGLVNALEELGRKSSFEKTFLSEDAKDGVEKSFHVGINKKNMNKLMKEYDLAATAPSLQQFFNGKKPSKMSEGQIKKILKRNRDNMSDSNVQFFKSLLAAKKAKNYNDIIKRFNAMRITCMTVISPFLKDTDEAKTMQQVTNMVNMAKQTIKTLRKNQTGIVSAIASHISKKAIGRTQQIGRGITPAVNAVKGGINKTVGGIKKFDGKITSKFLNTKPMRKIANSKFGRFYSRINNSRFSQHPVRFVKDAKWRLDSRMFKFKQRTREWFKNTKFGKSFLKIKKVWDKYNPFKLIANLMDFTETIKRYAIKAALMFVGSLFLLVVIINAMVVFLDHSSYLNDFSDYTVGNIIRFFGDTFEINEDHTVVKDEFGTDLTQANTMKMLIGFEEEYINELNNIGKDNKPTGENGYADLYGQKFDETFGENVYVKWVNQKGDIIPYNTNIKEIMSLTSTQMQQDRMNNIVLHNLYASRLWHWSHMYNINASSSELVKAFNTYTSSTELKESLDGYTVDKKYRIDKNKYKYAEGGETGDQIVFCDKKTRMSTQDILDFNKGGASEGRIRATCCMNAYHCSVVEDLKKHKISYLKGDGELICWEYKLKKDTINVPDWISTAWYVENGNLSIGPLSYNKGSQWAARDGGFKSGNVDVTISGTHKIEEYDKNDNKSIAEKYQHLTGRIFFDIVETVYDTVTETITDAKTGETKTITKQVERKIKNRTTYMYDYDVEDEILTLDNLIILRPATCKIKRIIDTSICKGHCGGHPYLELTGRITGINEEKLELTKKCEDEGTNDYFGAYCDERIIYEAAIRQKYSKQGLEGDKLDKKVEEEVTSKYPYDLVDLDNKKHIINLIGASLDIYNNYYSVLKEKGKYGIDIHDTYGHNKELIKDLTKERKGGINNLDKVNYKALIYYESNIKERLLELNAFHTWDFVNKVIQKIKEEPRFQDDIRNLKKSDLPKKEYKFKNRNEEQILKLFFTEKNDFELIDSCDANRIQIDTSHLSDYLKEFKDEETGKILINTDTLDLTFLYINYDDLKNKFMQENMGYVSFFLISLKEQIDNASNNDYIDFEYINLKKTTYKVNNNNPDNINDMTPEECLQRIFKEQYYNIINSNKLKAAIESKKASRKTNIKTIKGEKIDISKLDGLYMYRIEDITNDEAFAMGEWGIEDELWCYHFYNQDWKEKYDIVIENNYTDGIKNLIKEGTIGTEGLSQNGYALAGYINDLQIQTVVNYCEKAIGAEYNQDLRYSPPKYYDCSSLAYFAWSIAGIDLVYPRKSGAIPTAALEASWLNNKGLLVSTTTLKGVNLMPGDLIFYSTKNNGRFKNITHVAIYVGNGKRIHARGEKYGVVKDSDYDNGHVVAYASPSLLGSNVPNKVPGCKSDRKTYMPYTAVTNTKSDQYAYLNNKNTKTHSKYGIRMYDNRYFIAVGNGYLTNISKKIGTKIDVELENGKILKCIVGDIKADKDTDNSNRFHKVDGSVIEFIVDYKIFGKTDESDKAKETGDISYMEGDEFKGKISNIRVVK